MKQMGMKNPTSEVNKKVAMNAYQKYLVATFLMGSHRRLYGYLIEYTENSSEKGNDELLKTLNSSYTILPNWKQDQRFTISTLQYGGGNIINHHMTGEDSDDQLHTTSGGGGKALGSGSQGRR